VTGNLHLTTSDPNVTAAKPRSGIHFWFRHYVPVPIKRLIGRTLALLAILRHLPVLGKRRGWRTLFSTWMRHRHDHSGWPRFMQWCREAIAYELRQDAAHYQEWVARRVSARSALGSPTSDIVAVVALTEGGRVYDVDVRALGSRYILLAHDRVELAPHALASMTALAESHAAEVVYADEDTMLDGHHLRPRFKPELSIDLQRAIDFVGPVFLVRRELLVALLADSGGMGLIPYEIVLRLFERGVRFARCPDVLTHFTQPRSVALGPDQIMARDLHLNRMYGAELGSALSATCNGRFVTSDLAASHRISVIVPTRDRVDLLASCIDSLIGLGSQFPFEILIMNNGSREPTTLEWLKGVTGRYRNVRVIDADYDFNWSRLNNHGVREATGDLLLFLNNDIEADSPGWLDVMACQTLRADVGTVGALLTFPDGTVQHAGVVLGIGGFADHVYSGIPLDDADDHLFVSPYHPRNVLANTGACLMMARERFDECGGFDEELRICGDVDICARLHSAGYLNVYEPRARLVHHESATRSRAPLAIDEIQAAVRSCRRYLIDGDPMYNPNLTLWLRYPTYALPFETKSRLFV
jgi:O-antigen biosynthesis protein